MNELLLLLLKESLKEYKKVKLQQKNAFIVGTEVTGIPKSVLKKCDIIAEIPMKGKKESLNVSVAFGVALFIFGVALFYFGVALFTFRVALFIFGVALFTF